MTKHSSITRRGAALLGGASALLAGGFLAGDGFFIIMGLCGIILAGAAWLLGKLTLRNLTADIHLPSHLSAGTPFELELTLHNHRKFIDAFNTSVSLHLPGNFLFHAISPWTAAGSAARIHRNITLAKRGFSDTHHATLSTTFPLGLFLAKRHIEIRREITITPRPIIPLELSRQGCLHDTLPRNGCRAGQTFGEPRGIRPWQAGDSARRIHWPASARSLARGHGLRVREYDPPGFFLDTCHIIFHSFATGGEMLREDRFERALSLLAGSITDLQRQGIPCTLTADFNNWTTVELTSRIQVVECLRSLAQTSRARGTESHDLEAALHAAPAHHTLMIISDMPPDSWQHLLIKHPRSLMIDIRQIRYHRKTLRASA